MNSIKKFMEIFESKRQTESWFEMTAILKECNQYFKNIPASERGVILSILFNEQVGLLTFLTNAMDRPNINKNLEGTIIQTFQLLRPIMNKFPDDYRPYIEKTLAVLKLALTIKSSYFLKDAAAQTIVEFIKTFKSLDLDFNAAVIQWVKKFHLYSLSERRLLLHVISVISSYFPQTEAFIRSSRAILRQLTADYLQTYKEIKKRGSHCLPMYIEAFNNILRNFSPSDEDIGTIAGRDSIYRNIKNLCNSKDNQKNKQLMQAVVNLLSEHLTLFGEYVYEDYEFWHFMLGSFVKQELYGDTAIRALRVYYKTMGNVLGRKNSADDRKVFLNLRDSFVKSLSDGRICSTELRLTVYGFSQIIEPCKNYLADAGVEEMFSLIAHRTIPLYAREDDETAHFEEIADYQEALSRIIRYLENVSIDQIRALTTLCSLMIKRYPELSITDQQYSTLSLNRTIINVRYTKEILYQDFITNIIHDGIVWSCSHMLFIDAEHKRDNDKSLKHPITYKDYVSLWQGLVNPENYESTSENSDARSAALQGVVDEIIITCIALMNTLNLETCARENSGVIYDVKSSHSAVNETDFRIFLNLVDLYVVILPNIENFLWHNTSQKFLYEIIKNSYKNPLISSFYKLANAALTSSGEFQTTNHQDTNNESVNLVLQYLWNILDALPRYQQELQISCLQLILNVPETFVRRIVDRAVGAFEISLNLGLTNYEIATDALSALERWHKYFGSDLPKNFINQLVPRLEKYLQSEDCSTRLVNDIEELRQRQRIKTVTLFDDEQTVEGLQKRILLFFGSLDNETMLDYINRRSQKTGATWSKKDLLKYPMPFPDTNLDVNLDSMIPRIIELALGSGDRRTRLAASEVLHTIVAFMLGRTVHFLSYDNDRFTELYETLCPALLRLACDSDDVVMQLYHPLVMQLTHWLSSRLMLNSGATIFLVDSLFDGLGDEANSAVREVSGIYLAEFVHWSIKQISDKSLAQCPTNINLIVRRIVNFALDPALGKRVAAATAFNHLYRILRECEEIVEIFWLEILHAFVKSLDGCRDTRIHDALRHVERVLVEKSRIFNDPNSRCNRPAGFSGVMSEDAAKWMLKQCGSLDRHCRIKCMEMFVSISRTVDSCNSPKALISSFLKTDGIQGLNEILIGDLSAEIRNGEGLTILLRTLDLYIWLVRDNLIDNEILFGNKNPDRNLIFVCIENFVIEILTIADNVVLENSASTRLREFVRLRSQRCETVITLIDFILVIMDVTVTNQNLVPDKVFNLSFFSLISICLMKPQKLGFDSSNLQLTEQLPAKIEQLLKKAMQSLPEMLMNSLKDLLAAEIETFSEKMFLIEDIIERRVLMSENSVRGLILLQKCQLLKLCQGGDEIVANASTRIFQIFNILKTDDLGKKVCFHPKTEMKNYLQALVELLLLEYDVNTIKIIVELLTNNVQLYRSDLTIVTHGEYFLSVFKDVVIQGFLRDLEKTLNLLEKSINDNPENILRIVEALVIYLQRWKSEDREMIEKSADLIMTKFHIFERSVNNLEHRRNVFLNIYATVVRLKRNPLIERHEDIYRWILRELVSCNRFKYKIRLLRDFLVCLTNENSNDNPELMAILYNLKNNREITDSNDASGRKIASPETINCLQNLTKLLAKTKSSIILDAIMNFSMGAGKTLCEDRVSDHLRVYYDSLQAPNVLKSLELTYKRFMNSTNTIERFDILRYFLLPSLAHCAPQTMEKFFELNMREIYTIILQKPTSNTHDRQQLFIAKIACYNLIEIMFANLPSDRIDSKDRPITIETQDSSSSEKFSRKIFRSTLPIRQFRAVEGDDKEIVRLLHCSAYKCSLAIVSMTKDERFYLAVFAENREKEQLIWENIVDIERKYELRQTSKELPKEREKLVNIRKSERDKGEIEDRYSYIKSYDLATSTLSENIGAYDLNAVNLSSRKNYHRSNEIMSLRLEIDDLNEHECMPLICGLLIHMLNNEISKPRNDEIHDTLQLPKWMSQFRLSMWSEHANVRLFMLKIVLNTQAVFRPYADFFIEPVTNTIYRCLKGDSLNYVITDALIMLIDWREISVPKTERGKNLARLMFGFLVERGTEAPTRYIVKYNMSIIEMIVEAWHDCLVIPPTLESRMTRMDRTAIKLILIFLSNKMADKIVGREDIWEYLKKLLANWKIEEEPVLQAHEAAGLMLKYSLGMEHFEPRKIEIMEILRNSFRSMQIPNPGRLVRCINAMCKAFSELAEDFFQFVSSSQLRVEPTNMVKCLEVFSLMIPKLSVENIVKELTYMQFHALLENKVMSCEKICLSIIEQLVPVLGSSQLLPLVDLVTRYSDHKISNYRRICYDVLAKLYKKYFNEHSPEAIEIIKTSRRILLSGLLDPAEEMQKLSLNFWSEITNSRKKCSERLLDILDTYESGMETNFLQITTLVMLELTRESSDCEKKMFEPLHNCTYNNHDISISWKSRNYESRIPLFAPSIASQLNQRFTQYSYAMGTSSYNAQDSQENFVLRSTEPPQFETTYLSLAPIPEKSADDTDEDGIFVVPRVPELSRNKVSRRFLADWSDINVAVKKRQEARTFSEQEYRKEYLARQRGTVRLYRKYRIGDFPDIEISHETILGPMQALVKRDPTICKDLIVSIVRSLMDRTIGGTDSDAYCSELSKRLSRILRERRQNGGIVAAILEIMFNVRELEFPWDVVADVAKMDGLYAQGALLTEQSLIYVSKDDSEPPAKRPRIVTSGQRDEGTRDRWIELASLYESMDDLDAVLGIFRGEMFSKELHMASIARAANDWSKAEAFYRKALQTEMDEKLKRHCLEGTFECLSRLGKWKKLESDIESKVDVNFDNLLDTETTQSRWIAPWIFRTHTRGIMDGRGNERFLNALELFLRDASKYQCLKESYGEETSVIISSKKPEVSRDFLNGSWEKIRQQWIQLSPLAVALRSRAIVKLQGIHDIDGYLKTLASHDIADGSRELTNLWKNSVPSIRDDLLAWDIHSSYRSYFIANLIEKIGQTESQEGINLVNEIRSTRVKQTIILIECALGQKNVQLAKKNLLRVESELDNCHQDLIDEFELNAVKFKFLDAQLTNDSTTSLRYYTASWEQAQIILQRDSLSVSSEIAVRQMISEMASSLAEIATSRVEFFKNLSSRTTILQDIFAERIDFDDVKDSLNFYSLTNLQKCCNLADDVADCHLRLSKYCYERISKGEADEDLSREFVRSTLRAMSCGSIEATHYFPCLLKDDILANEEVSEIFMYESSRVETWRFLIWQTQLLSHLGTQMGNVVVPIVKRMIDAYPNAMVYSLRLILDTNFKLRDDPAIIKLKNFLAEKHEFNTFLEAMKYIVQPELYMEYYLREFLRNLPKGRDEAHETLMSQLYSESSGDAFSTVQGDMYREIVAPYRREIERIVEMPIGEIVEHVGRLVKRLEESMKKRRMKNDLRFYSPWLKDFVGRDIEVPGQYTGDKKPMPRYHAKIVKIESTIKVMQSIRKPIRITIIANDANSHRFLVKFGEDLRLDQRVEQIFDVMNKTLGSDVACSQRRLSIDTYQVFPLSGSLGLIQWIDGTKTLKDYINFALDDNEKVQQKYVELEYRKWIKKAAPDKAPSVQYKEALVKYKSADVCAKIMELTNKIRWDSLRRTFVMLSSSMESFMSMRKNFTSTYATMCIGQWILGIGDRHLGNTLISIESGRSLGIDFGSAFGGGIDQSVPELMPFRLTAQIKGLLRPFSEYDSMGATMIHAMRALRNGKGPLLACLDVVAHEQLNWEEHVNKLSQETENMAIQIEWLPAKKVRIVSKKLDGVKASSITLEQLAERHPDEKYFKRYEAIVNGTDFDDYSKRSNIREDNLSPEEQVQCLIEQATDLNVLGRTYVGWAPWL